MVKVYGPMMSLDASGTVGKAITFSKWKGRNYARERVIPANPKSGAQVGRRAMFTFLTQAWNAIIAGTKATWQDLADQLVALPFNAYASHGMEGWHNFLTPMQGPLGTRTSDPSDNALDSAAWEENRIKLTLSGTALNVNWGIVLFASLATMAGSPSVAQAILVRPDTTFASHTEFWTPPSVATWYFDSITFSEDGKQAAVGGEVSAVP